MQKTLWFIWSAFIYATVFYIGIAYFLIDSSSANPGAVPVIAAVTILLSVITAVISILIRIKLVSIPMQDGTLDVSTEQGFQRYQTISIITWALSESIAVFGLVLVFISGTFYYVIPFSVISLILLVIQMPRLNSTS